LLAQIQVLVQLLGLVCASGSQKGGFDLEIGSDGFFGDPGGRASGLLKSPHQFSTLLAQPALQYRDIRNTHFGI
jgi:hypothetical protein